MPRSPVPRLVLAAPAAALLLAVAPALAAPPQQAKAEAKAATPLTGAPGNSPNIAEIARGMGCVYSGLGEYATGLAQLRTSQAQAAAVDQETAIRWNEYTWSLQQQCNRRYYERLASEMERNQRSADEVLRRLRDNPEPRDIERGDALNVLYDQLTAPRTMAVLAQYARLPLADGALREIPFHYASEAITLSLRQLAGEAGWPEALRAEAFNADRQAYQQAITAALAEGAKGEELSAATTARLRQALAGLARRLAQAGPKLPPASRREAEAFLRSLAGMTRMIRGPEIADLVAAFQPAASGATVRDLLAFMQAFNLRFGAVQTPRQRLVYNQLYADLADLRDRTFAQLEARDRDRAQSLAPDAELLAASPLTAPEGAKALGGPDPTAIFDRFSLDALTAESSPAPRP